MTEIVPARWHPNRLAGNTVGPRLLTEGSGWQPTFHANEYIISDPNLIRPGMVLRIPGGF